MHAIEKQALLHVFTKQLSVALQDDSQVNKAHPYFSVYCSVVYGDLVHLCTLHYNFMYKNSM